MSLYTDRQQQNRPFFDAWESVPEEKRVKLLKEKLEEYIHYTSSNMSFYKERLRYPLNNVPFLLPDYLSPLLPPHSDELVVGGYRDYSVFYYTRPDGVTRVTILSHFEMEQLTGPINRGFFALGLCPSDRVINLCDDHEIDMPFVLVNRALQQYGAMNFPFSAHQPIGFVFKAIKEFRVNCVFGSASTVLRTLRAIRNIDKQSIQIEKFFCCGGPFDDTEKEELTNHFGLNLIGSPLYGSIDTWALGYQCLQCPRDVFHVHDDEVYLEIIDETTNLPSEPGKSGTLYVTTYARRLTPLVRYKVGDKAAWLRESCPCGRTTPLLYSRVNEKT